MPNAPSDILAIVRRGGLLGLEPDVSAAPLTGGVSSDIWRVDLPGGAVCVKRALPRLKVQADWRAPVERNAFEAAWLGVVAGIAPEAAPPLIFRDETADALVMTFLDPTRHRLWKTELRDGRAEADEAAAVGRQLARIHGATANSTALAERFPSDRIFHEIRLAPYLLATAERHPDLARPLKRLARRTAITKLALVHGDVSPKNILLGPDGPVFLDAECAWYGDPAFDLAFCLNHLLLKCLWTPAAAEGFLACFDALVEAYFLGVDWEPRDELEARAATLLPGLFLARVDGKSPVEYLTDPGAKDLVRSTARRFLLEPVATLMPIRAAWAEEMGA
jgi:aminoglycoside phosphotransferase (APT) family kinase protein